MDLASVRRVDEQGFLHVDVTNISKATVNGYLGSEIPDGAALGLAPDRIYQLLRDPKELEKAASTFNNLPILRDHQPVASNDYPKDLIIGSTGTEAVYDEPYLKNSIVIWTAQDIADIESKKKCEISCGYRYRVIIEPGFYQGVAIDGRMVDIIGNHVAIVDIGRAGPDIVVADSELIMSKGKLSRRALSVRSAVSAYLKPKLAQDKQLPDLKKVLLPVNAKEFVKQKAKLAQDIQLLVKPVLAADADLTDLAQVIDAFCDDPESSQDEDMTAMDSPAAEIMAMCKGKLSDEECAKIDALLKQIGTPAAMDTDPDKDDDKVDKKAMDAALKATEAVTIKRMNDIHTAEKEVRPLVGEITVAMDSAEAVYKFALEHRKQDLTDVHPSAYRSIVKMLINMPSSTPTIALDHTAQADLSKKYKNADRYAIRS